MSTEVILNDSKQYIVNNIKQQQDSLKRGVTCSVILISGAPGIGKSDLMIQIAEELGMGLNPQYLGTMLLEQFGMPLPTTDKDTKFQKWSDPEFYSIDNLKVQPKSSDDNGIILFMDDIHLATKTIQTYFFQLLTYRSIHNKKMPENFVMVAAGNRSTDRAGAQAIMAPIVNRFFILDVKAQATDWIKNFAIPYRVRHDVISFLELYPDLLQSAPLESKPWASPRSWTYLSDSINMMGNRLSTAEYLNLSSGHIGEEYASHFIEYIRLFSRWNGNDYLLGNKEFPDLKTMEKIDSYTLMSAIVAEFMKTFRDKDGDVNDALVAKQIIVIKKLFDLLTTSCKEIIPLGLRSIIVSESLKSKQALLYYKLIQGNDQLLEVAKKLLSVGNTK